MPIPKDTSLSALTAKLDRAVAREEKRASGPDAPEFAAALQKRQTLDTLMSTTPQIHDYRARFGVEWNERFTPLSRIMPSPSRTLLRPALSFLLEM